MMPDGGVAKGKPWPLYLVLSKRPPWKKPCK
jgi:hypothetical protein